jgi:UDPglucose--hexose-1-phosphate uridylyltransferase
MAEIRVDPITGLRTIVGDDAGGLLRPDAPDIPRDAVPDLVTAAPARGAHEVLVNAQPPVTALAELAPAALAAAMTRWRERIRHHVEAGASCVHVCVDEGAAAAGSPQPGSRAHLYALDFVPAAIAREREHFGAYAVRTMGGNLLGDLVQDEVRRRERIVAIDDEAVCFAPFASRTPFQLLLAPRRAVPRFEDDGPLGAALLHDVLQRLARHLGGSPPLSLWVRTAPRGADHFGWRIDVVPRLDPVGGLELGTGVNRNPVAPEAAAAALRDAGDGGTSTPARA